MKKVTLFSLLTVCMLVCLGISGVYAGDMLSDVTTSVSTYPVSGAGSTIPNSTVPNWLPEISSNTPTISILKIVVSNSDASIPQTITLYDDCRSTNTVTAIWSVVIPSGTYQAQVYQEDFAKNTRLPAHRGLYIRKSSVSSTVVASILYE